MKYLENPSRKFSGKIFFFSPLRKVNFVFIKCFSYFPTTKNMYIADFVNQFSFFWFKVCRNYTFLLPNLWCKVMCGILINPALFLRFNAWVKWFFRHLINDKNMFTLHSSVVYYGKTNTESIWGSIISPLIVCTSIHKRNFLWFRKECIECPAEYLPTTWPVSPQFQV